MHLTAKRYRISGGISGAVQTVRYIRRLIHQGRRDPYVRQVAMSIVRSVPEKDYLGEITALGNFVRQKIRYVKDPHGVETLTEPRALLLKYRMGDCDDHVILLGALLQAIGHPVQLVIGGFAPSIEEYTHIWLRTHIHGRGWIPMDPIAKNRPVIGWEPPAVHRRYFNV